MSHALGLASKSFVRTRRTQNDDAFTAPVRLIGCIASRLRLTYSQSSAETHSSSGFQPAKAITTNCVQSVIHNNKCHIVCLTVFNMPLKLGSRCKAASRHLG